jgi:hypothetical protein
MLHLGVKGVDDDDDDDEEGGGSTFLWNAEDLIHSVMFQCN